VRIISPDELKAERVAALGVELGETYHQLLNELIWILFKWEQYRALFGTKPERVDLLNRAAPVFFVIVQDTLWDDILLHLCRLTDSPTSVGRPNLSVKRLPMLIQHPVFRNEVTKLVDTAVAKATFARDWRNRRLAHRDLALSITQASVPLAHASRASVIDALESLNCLLKRIHQHFFGRDIDLNLLGEPGDADALLRVLADGLEAARARWQGLEDGTLLPTDWIGPPAI